MGHNANIPILWKIFPKITFLWWPLYYAAGPINPGGYSHGKPTIDRVRPDVDFDEIFPAVCHLLVFRCDNSSQHLPLSVSQSVRQSVGNVFRFRRQISHLPSLRACYSSDDPREQFHSIEAILIEVDQMLISIRPFNETDQQAFNALKLLSRRVTLVAFSLEGAGSGDLDLMIDQMDKQN